MDRSLLFRFIPLGQFPVRLRVVLVVTILLKHQNKPPLNSFASPFSSQFFPLISITFPHISLSNPVALDASISSRSRLTILVVNGRAFATSPSRFDLESVNHLFIVAQLANET